MPKRVKHPIKPESLYQKGESFHFTAHYLNQQPMEVLGPAGFAFVTCMAFACEVYLKVLAFIETGRQPLETHHLWFLFEELPPEMREAIDREWTTKCLEGLQVRSNHPDIPAELKRSPQSFRQAMEQSSRAFVDWRYGDSDGKVMAFHMIGLAPILRAMILERKPEWRKSMKRKAAYPAT